MADGESVIVGSETDLGGPGPEAATAEPIWPSLKSKHFISCWKTMHSGQQHYTVTEVRRLQHSFCSATRGKC